MTGKQRIMVVDDERLNRKVLSELLDEHYDIIIAKNGQQALKRVEGNSDIDLILLDVMMPEMNGHEVLRRLKSEDSTKDIPVIFITALGSAGDEEIGLALGAADYISKPFHPSIVKLRVGNHLRFTHQRKLLETLAGKDGLTEIDNRRRFDEMLVKEWRRSARNGLPMSLAMIDVDYFKPFNDHYGHAHGDTALRSVANVLTWQLNRPADMAARYGGEEFILMFPDTDAEGARELAEKARAALEALAIPHALSTVAPHVTISIGGVTMIGSEASPQILLEAADSALYEAKARGRNRVVWR